MRSMRYAVIIGLLLMIPSVALAQETRFEVTPYFAWRHGNDIGDVSGLEVDLESGVAYGFMVDVRITGGLYAEFIYSHRNTPGTVFVPVGVAPGVPAGTFDIEGSVDYYQGGLLYQFDTRYYGLKPFIVGTLGAGSLSPEGTDGSTNFSVSFGGGVKYMFSRNIGFRGEYRLFSTSTDFVERGGWCDWWGFCYTGLFEQNLYQSQFAAGIIIGF